MNNKEQSVIIKGILKKGEYFDSVTLMIAANKINQLEEVIDSAVVMGTKENKAILKASGFLIEQFQDAGDTDLLIAVKTETRDTAEKVLKNIDTELKKLIKKKDTPGHFIPKSIDAANEALPGANLSLISVPGKYAADEAMKALKKGLHVMIFSDHVPLEKEIELKKYAREHHLFVMGPDCGTAIINGVPLAFANVVKPGNIGIVAASGTGLQEVTTLISNAGGGISQAIGTGGRDVKKEVGGIMFIAALQALAADENTHAILLVSKPPHPEVLQKIGKEVKTIEKPVAAVFLGADPQKVKTYGIIPALDLEEGAKRILELAGIKGDFPNTLDINKIANQEVKKLNKDQRYLRALFTGGTFCSETQVILQDIPGIFSNTPTANSLPLKNIMNSEKHTIIDLGADEFTSGKPHPMIDFSTRNKRIIQEAKDKETAVILMDLVLGYGANLNPIPEIIPVINKAKQLAQEENRKIPVVCSVTGTDEDPQNRKHVVEALKKAGVIVCGSNAKASKLCEKMIYAFGDQGGAF
jgi:succinyl-CoA synthetase alpha subunit